MIGNVNIKVIIFVISTISTISTNSADRVLDRERVGDGSVLSAVRAAPGRGVRAVRAAVDLQVSCDWLTSVT